MAELSASEKSHEELAVSDPYTSNSEFIWTRRPSVLLNHVFEVIPRSSYSQIRNANAAARFILYLTFTRLLLNPQERYLSICLQGAAGLGLSVSYYQSKQISSKHIIPLSKYTAPSDHGVSHAEESAQLGSYFPDDKHIRVGVFGHGEEPDVVVSAADWDRMVTDPREAPGRQSVRLSNAAQVYGNRPPQHTFRDDGGLEDNTVGIAKFVSQRYG